MAKCRNQTSDDDHEWYDPSNNLAQADSVDPALNPDLEINGEYWLLDWRLHHFLDPFQAALKGEKNERTTDKPFTRK